MKKILTVILAIATTVSLAACGGKNDAADNSVLGKYFGYQVNIFGWKPVNRSMTKVKTTSNWVRRPRHLLS